jgi:DNA-binding transcriptional LysR family regulator
VPVRGNLSSNSVETILAAVGIGMFHRASLVGEFRHTDVVTVLDEFVNAPSDDSLIWPKRRFVPTRIRSATDFLAAALSLRV